MIIFFFLNLHAILYLHNTNKSSKSLDSLYSTGSSKQSGLTMYKRKPARPPGIIAPASEVRQRVMSARLHKLRNLQNQLGDSQQHITVMLY